MSMQQRPCTSDVRRERLRDAPVRVLQRLLRSVPRLVANSGRSVGSFFPLRYEGERSTRTWTVEERDDLAVEDPSRQKQQIRLSNMTNGRGEENNQPTRRGRAKRNHHLRVRRQRQRSRMTVRSARATLTSPCTVCSSNGAARWFGRQCGLRWPAGRHGKGTESSAASNAASRAKQHHCYGIHAQRQGFFS